MAHDDDILNLEALHCKFERSRSRMEFTIRLIRRNKIGNIAQNEYFARCRVEDCFRSGAGIAAGNDQRFWCLTFFSEFLITCRFRREMLAHEGLVTGEECIWNISHGFPLSLSKTQSN